VKVVDITGKLKAANTPRNNVHHVKAKKYIKQLDINDLPRNQDPK
jgi:hypothetical protein